MSPTPKDINSQDLEVRLLKPEDDLSTFDCSRDDLMGLNDFIHSDALQYQEENLGVTHLFFHNEHIVGFATLAMAQIEAKLCPPSSASTTIKYFPALLIGRLGVHNDYRDRNIGQNICLWCLGFAQQVSKKIGCRLIVVLTQGETVNFYKRCSFSIAPRHENKLRILMYLQVPH